MYMSRHAFMDNLGNVGETLAAYFQEVFKVYADPARNNSRYILHMVTWLRSTLPQVLSDFDPAASASNIYKVKADGPAGMAERVHRELQEKFNQAPLVYVAAAVLHDIAKTKQDPNHEQLSFEIFQDLCATDFECMKHTRFYQEIVQNLSPEELRLIGLLIRFHSCGAVNMDGNMGALEKIMTTVAEEGVAVEMFFDKLSTFVLLDRASVGYYRDGNAFDEGYLTYFDYWSFQKILDRRVHQGDYFSSLQDVAAYITYQLIMFGAHKHMIYEKYEPIVEDILNNLFTEKQQAALIKQLDARLRNIDSTQYINSYYFVFAKHHSYLAEEKPMQAMFQDLAQENYSNDMIKRLAIVKLYAALAFDLEKTGIDRIPDITTATDRQIFKTSEEAFLTRIKIMLDQGALSSGYGPVIYAWANS